MFYCGMVGPARLVLLLCQQARCEARKENWAGKSVEAERRSATTRDAREEKGSLQAEKLITKVVNFKSTVLPCIARFMMGSTVTDELER